MKYDVLGIVEEGEKYLVFLQKSNNLVLRSLGLVISCAGFFAAGWTVCRVILEKREREKQQVNETNKKTWSEIAERIKKQKNNENIVKTIENNGVIIPTMPVPKEIMEN